MALTEVKIRSESASIGMFVSKLDRPWLETPFPIQGFRIDTPTQVSQLKELCQHIFVDLGLGEAPHPRLIVHEWDPAADTEAVKELEALKTESYAETANLHDEMQKAGETYQKLHANIGEVMNDLRDGKKLDFDRLREGVNAMIESILRNPDAFACLTELRAKDVYTYRHALGTSVWCATFGRHLGMPRQSIEHLAQGGLLLDVGKSMLPLSLLNQEGALTEESLQIMRTHVDHSVAIAKETPGIEDVVIDMIATHHERFDGTGYPAGLKGRDIPMFGRIAGIADTYDALTSQRMYAEAMSPHGAVNVLYEWRGVDFQAELVEQFIQSVGIYPTGTLVELNTGEVGVIISLNGTRRLQPRLMLLLNADKTPRSEFKELDLFAEAAAGNTQYAISRGLPPDAYDIDTDNLFL